RNVFARASNQLVDKGFDYEAGKTWIYPTNYPVRDYQFAIVKEALFKNTLVILPTGLGKTFIAAVVMYNIYRWYPDGKIIFMAPTRPLVAQQIDACHKVTGISHVDTTQMTGTNLPEERKRMWMKKRVFYLTPQVLVNDLARNICPAESIKCIVVDEAHKALGNHAYCQVIRELQAYTNHFRILALTATPGSDTQAVKLVLSNLLISHVEMRTEDSDDVKQYTHIRDIEKIVVPLGEKLLSIKSRFLDIINIYLKRLTQRRAMTAKNPGFLSKFQILRMREDFSQHPPNNIDKFSYGLIMADFSLCISLYHAYELLLLHGARPFYNFLIGIINGEKSIPHARSELMKNYEFEMLLKEIQENYIVENINSNQNMEAQTTGKKPGHPKLEKLLEVVLKHFKNRNDAPVKDTRVMIFSQYRDSVQEITDMLNFYKPMIKPMSFIGQSTKTSTNAGFSQKQQLKVIQQFRSGGYNTLVSTCVGEEGLDIGEVDLIVCYDCPKSPIRLVQRMGRTGRLRGGKIIILIAEGKEEQMYNSCESKKKSVHRSITKGFAFAQLYQNSPSLIPPDVKPTCVKTVVTVEARRAPLKFKGKYQDDGFLNEDELNEFKSRFEIPKSKIPLLPASEIICLKDFQVQKEESNKEVASHKITSSTQSRLSLSNWMLWQTTPQRTHMVTHSLKSFSLIEAAGKISFSIEKKDYSRPNCENSEYSKNNILLQNSRLPISNTSIKSSSAPLIDLCKDESDFFDNVEPLHGENNLKDLDSHFLKEKTSVIGDFRRPVLSPSLCDTLVQLRSNEKDNLLKRMFGIGSMKLPFKFKNLDIKSPPVVLDSIIFQESSGIQVEAFSQAKPKSCMILNILNKKMKARLKRKTKELGIDLSLDEKFKFSSNKSPIIASFTQQKSVLESTIRMSSSPHKSVECNKPLQENKIVQNLVPKVITFDIDFDVPETFDEDEIQNDSEVKTIEIKQNKNDVLNSDKKSNSVPDLDGDSSEILQQFFTKREDTSEKLESSFIIPLTVKRVLFENNCETPKTTKRKRSVLKEKNNSILMSSSSIKNKNLRTPLSSTRNHPEVTECIENHTDDKFIMDRNKTEDVVTQNYTATTHSNDVEKNNTDEFSQYSLTQLLSLIDNTENTECTKNSKNNSEIAESFYQNISKENFSSDGEIEPTPPKEKIPTITKFFYRSNSFSLDSDSKHKDDVSEDKNETLKKLTSFSSVSFDLTNIQFPSNHETDTVSCKQATNPPIVKKVLKDDDQSVSKIKSSNVLDTGFCENDLVDLEDNVLHDSTHKEMKICNDYLENNKQIPTETNSSSSPLNNAASISFDLFDFNSSFYERDIEKEKEFNSPNKMEKIYRSSGPDTVNVSKRTNTINAVSSNFSKLPSVQDTKCDKIEFKHTVKSNDRFNNKEPHSSVPEVSGAPINSVKCLNPVSMKNSNDCKNDDNFFESAADENIFFDVSFDFPEFNMSSSQKDMSEEIIDKTIKKSPPNVAKKPLQESCVFNEEASKSTVSHTAEDSLLNSISNKKTNKYTELHAAKASSMNYKKSTTDANFTSNAQNILPINDMMFKKPVPNVRPTKTEVRLAYDEFGCIKNKNSKHTVNNLLVKDFEISDTQDFFSPQMMNHKKYKNSSTSEKSSDQSNCGQIQSDKIVSSKDKLDKLLFSKSTESSESLFENKQNVASKLSLKLSTINQTNDNFDKPVSTKHKSHIVNCGKRKRKLTKNEKKFLLSQASVSGSDSSDYDVEADEDLDVLEASFIDDNTVMESPKNQHCMYLESVKNVAGLPRQYKFKDIVNRRNQISSQPLDEGCSEYLLDSFCVDDDEVIFSSSDGEMEPRTKPTITKTVGKKRKRIIALSESSSSEEEAFVKKIKSPDEDKFVRKLSPESNKKEKPTFLRKLKQKVIISSDEENFRVNNKLSPEKSVINFYQNESNISGESNVGCSKSGAVVSKNEGKPELSENELQKHIVNEVYPDSNCPNFSFDLEWDNDIPVSDFQCDNIGLSHKTEDIPKSFSISNKNTATATELQTRLDEDFIDPSIEILQDASNQKIASTTSHNINYSAKKQIPFISSKTDLKSSKVEVSSTNAFTTSNHINKTSDSKTILVDSRELASGKPVISFLRNKFNMNPVVMQITSADYIISNKIAVIRILDSNFPGSIIPLKVIEKVKAISELYEKPFVIIETDRRKRSLGFNKSSTKCLQFSVHINVHPTVKVLYSNSVDDTASLLYNLFEKEKQKGLHIDVPVVNPSSQKLFNFYNSLPHVSPACAFNFVYHFPSIIRFFKSSAEELKKGGSISNTKAKAIFQYLRNELLFDAFS
ncbi:fanconi anemia group M protein, partial [Trichonephila clavata]